MGATDNKIFSELQIYFDRQKKIFLATWIGRDIFAKKGMNMNEKRQDPLDWFGFKMIGNIADKYLVQKSRETPSQSEQDVIDWVKEPKSASHLSFTEAITISGKLREKEFSGERLLPWSEVFDSIYRHNDSVYRLKGTCPDCGSPDSLLRICFDAPKCRALAGHSGYLYFCADCGSQHLFIDLGEDAEEVHESSDDKIDIARLGFSVRVNNCLRTQGIETLGDLRRCPASELKKFRNFGSKCLKEVEDKLSQMGY